MTTQSRMQVTRQEVIDAARTWKGTPFVHQGRMKHVGVDCIGLVIGVGRELKLIPPDWDIGAYDRIPNPDQARKTLRALEDIGLIEEIPISEAKPGDFLFFRIRSDPQHFAFLTDRGMIHTMCLGDDSRLAGRKRSVCDEHRFGAPWARRAVAAFRIAAVVD